MTENMTAPEAGEVRIRDGKVEVFDGERWGPYKALPVPPGIRPQCRCNRHNKA